MIPRGRARAVAESPRSAQAALGAGAAGALAGVARSQRDRGIAVSAPITHPSSRDWAVGVVVPARDEALHISRCANSILRALEHAGAAPKSWVVVVADDCSDATALLAARELDGRGEVFEVAHRSVGAARRAGTAALLRHFSGHPRERLWILNTDADGSVPEDWVATHLELAERGAAAVAGVIRVDSFAEHGPLGARAFADTYALFADGSHPHVHGANIGVRADVYADVGGWRPVDTAEDHCLWNRVRDTGRSVVSSVASWVETSGRREGRAPDGFAATLTTTCENFGG